MLIISRSSLYGRIFNAPVAIAGLHSIGIQVQLIIDLGSWTKRTGSSSCYGQYGLKKRFREPYLEVFPILSGIQVQNNDSAIH